MPIQDSYLACAFLLLLSTGSQPWPPRTRCLLSQIWWRMRSIADVNPFIHSSVVPRRPRTCRPVGLMWNRWAPFTIPAPAGGSSAACHRRYCGCGRTRCVPLTSSTVQFRCRGDGPYLDEKKLRLEASYPETPEYSTSFLHARHQPPRERTWSFSGRLPARHDSPLGRVLPRSDIDCHECFECWCRRATSTSAATAPKRYLFWEQRTRARHWKPLCRSGCRRRGCCGRLAARSRDWAFGCRVFVECAAASDSGSSNSVGSVRRKELSSRRGWSQGNRSRRLPHCYRRGTSPCDSEGKRSAHTIGPR